MAERDRIARFFAPLTAGEPGAYSLTDDAALLTPPHPVIITTDSVITGIHVLGNASATEIAEKLVRRNLSDLAAMGAMPWRYTLNLHTPPGLPDAWYAEFAFALSRLQLYFGMVLVGGDSSTGRGPVHATLTCLGLATHGTLQRSTAHVGDDVYMTGTIGDAALGLKVLQHTLVLEAAMAEYLVERYDRPEPRLEIGARLHGLAHAVIDISDGLLADAAQLAQASQVQLQLTREALPLSDAARAVLAEDTSRWTHILTGGDDYELLFTAPPTSRAALDLLDVTRIGCVVAGNGVLLDGTHATGGYEHA